MPEVTDGRILRHEGVGVVEEIGSAVTGFKKGDRLNILYYFLWKNANTAKKECILIAKKADRY